MRGRGRVALSIGTGFGGIIHVTRDLIFFLGEGGGGGVILSVYLSNLVWRQYSCSLT